MYKMLLTLLFLATINLTSYSQTSPQIYHKLLLYKGRPVRIIKTADNNFVVLGVKEQFDTASLSWHNTLMCTKFSNTDTSIIWHKELYKSINNKLGIFSENRNSIFQLNEGDIGILMDFHDTIIKSSQMLFYQIDNIDGKIIRNNFIKKLHQTNIMV